MKKYFVSLLCLLLILSSTSSFADSSRIVNNTNKSDQEIRKLLEKDGDNNDKTVYNTSFSEIDLINEYKSKSDVELKKFGFSSSDIDDLRKLDPVNELVRLTHLESSEMKRQGYEDYQIEYIENLKVSPRSAARLSLSVSENKFYYTSGNTTARMKISWSWSRVPFFTFTDKLVASISETMYYNDNNSYSRVKYYILETGKYAYSEVNDFKPEGPSSVVSTNIDVKRFKANGQEWAKKGYAYVQFDRKAKINEVGVYGTYGHCTLSLNPSISLSSGGSVSFSPSSKVEVIDDYDKFN